MSVAIQKRATPAATSLTKALAVAEQGVISGVSMLTSVIVGRVCDVDALANYAVGMSVVAFFVGIHVSLVGTPYTVRWHKLRDRFRRPYLGATLINHGVLVIVSTLVAAIASAIAYAAPSFQDLAPVFAAIAVVLQFVLLRELSRRVSFASFVVVPVLLATGIVAFLQLICLGLGIQAGVLTPAFAIISLGIGCGAVGITWVIGVRSAIELRWSYAMRIVLSDWSIGGWMFAHQSVAMLHFFCALWLAKLLLPGMAGILAAYITIASLANPLVIGLVNVLSPQYARAVANHGVAEIRTLLLRTAGLLVAVTLPFLTAFVVFGEAVAQFIFDNPELLDHSTLLVLLASRVLVGCFSAPAHLLFVAARMPHRSFACVTAGLSVSVAAALILAPWLGITGVAAAWLAGAAVETVAFLACVPSALRYV